MVHVNIVHRLSDIKSPMTKVCDHEKIMYNMSLNKPRSKAVCFSTTMQPGNNEPEQADARD